MNELEKITINCSREYWLRDGFPANNNGKVHGSKNLFPWSVNERLTSVANGMDEIVDGFGGNRSLATVECSGDWSIQIKCFISEPRTPVEFFDAVVSVFHDFPDGSITGLGVICENKWQWHWLSDGCSIFDHVDQDLVLLCEFDIDNLNIVVRSRLLLDSDNRLRRFIGVEDFDEETTDWCKNSFHWVRLELLALHKYLGSEEGVSPRSLAAS